MTRRLNAIVVGSLLLIGCIAASFTPWGKQLEQDYGLSWLFAARGSTKPPENVLIVSMSGESADILEQPAQLRLWDRELHARLIQQLTEAGANTIIFDIFFQHPRDENSDEILIDAIRKSRRAILSQYIHRRKTGNMIVSEIVNPAQGFTLAPIGLAPFLLPRDDDFIYKYWLFHSDTGDTPTLPITALQVFAINTIGYQRFADLVNKAKLIKADELPANIMNSDQTRNLITTLRSAFHKSPNSLQMYLNEIEAADHQFTESEKRILRSLG
nr:CHASE2 domain-containing protein [Granulosicoccus sp.]